MRHIYEPISCLRNLASDTVFTGMFTVIDSTCRLLHILHAARPQEDKASDVCNVSIGRLASCTRLASDHAKDIPRSSEATHGHAWLYSTLAHVRSNSPAQNLVSTKQLMPACSLRVLC